MKPGYRKAGKRIMAKIKRFPLGTFMKQFSTEAQFREYLAGLRWKSGYVCPRCGSRHAYRLANGQYQCAKCHHQVSVTAGTVLHKTHMPLTQWFLAFYFVCQDKRGISAVQLAAMIGTTYKTAWSMLRRIRTAMGQRDESHQARQSPLSENAGDPQSQASICEEICPRCLRWQQCDPQRRLSQLHPSTRKFHPRTQSL